MQGIPVLNEVATLRWNSSKDYLLEIESNGFPCVAGKLLPKGSLTTLDQLFELVPAEQLVVKPLVSGGAKNTLKISRTDEPVVLEKILQWVQEEDFLVQPYIKEIVEVGEYSLLFFNGIFSHAVLIFVLPPSWDELRQRLLRRGEDRPETIDKRMLNARDEVAQARFFDFVIINALFETALFDLKAVVHSQRLRYAAQMRNRSQVFHALNLV
jgi:hypothetical protein